MIEELWEDEIISKVGGRFKLSALIQKRLVALNKGAPPLVNLATEDKMKIVIQEIVEDKIYLDTDMNLRIAAEAEAGPGGPSEIDLDKL
ncbi:MAG TPA: DNA-directed RNA polymerase subunit omega [Planctomycetaceae bacterium]|nr:DNA-directed RNA polymerase subunit omega [Planctomycetaceae bacterium]HIQ21907.1 DNA-directed RNA polymerase subunit omega [Planctomycetota bacterium]